MDLREMLMEFIPDITNIFKIGFIPSPSDLYELTAEQYEAYQKQSGDMSKPVYAVIPSNYKHLDNSNVINIVRKEEMDRIAKVAIFLFLYAEEGGCKSRESEDVLRFAAERLPRALSDGTKFERPALKVLRSGEKHLSEREEWVDLLASIMGEGTNLKMKITYQDTGKTEEISLPIEKQR